MKPLTSFEICGFAKGAISGAQERAETLINKMIQETRKLVEQHWPEIEALAQRLLVKERVNFLEIEAGASENPRSW